MASSILPSCGGVDWEEEEEQQRAVPSRSRTTTGGTSLPSLDPHHAPAPHRPLLLLGSGVQGSRGRRAAAPRVPLA
jgi:hypothetical protein